MFVDQCNCLKTTCMEKNRDFTVLALCLSAWSDCPPTRHLYWHWYWGPLLKFVITHAMMTYIWMLPLFLWWLWLCKFARAVSLPCLALFPLTEYSCLCNYEEFWKVMLPLRYVMQAVDPEAEFFPSLLLTVHNRWLFSTVLKNVNQQAVTEFWHTKMKLPQNLLAVIGFLWWRYCEHEDCASMNEKIVG